jgi:tetratricopeptide (TPR) repeat protein
MRAWAALMLALCALAACAQTTAQTTAAERACAAPAPTRALLGQKIARCTALIAAPPTPAALRVGLLARGGAYRLTQNDAAALADFNRDLQLDPRDAAGLNGRGLVYFDQNDLAHARSDFDAAIGLQPDSATAYVNRGDVERRQGDFAAALHDTNHAIELNPRAPYGWGHRGLLFVAKRRWELALADFVEALRINPNLAYALDGRGDADMGKGDVAEASDAYDQAGTSDLENGLYPQALAEEDKAIAAQPNDPTTLNNRCWIRAVADIELQAALADCQASLKLRPSDAAALDSNAFVQFRLGKWQAAIAGYDAALAKDTNQQASRFMRGVARLRAGDRADGNDDITTAEDMDASVATRFAGYGVTP